MPRVTESLRCGSEPLTAEQWAMVQANTGLIGQALKRSRLPIPLHEEAFSDAGMPCLIRCVRAFKPSLGFAFSTYAYRSIALEIAKWSDKQIKRISRQVSDESPGYLEASADDKHDSLEIEDLRRALGRLTHRERAVAVAWANGIKLAEIAELLGVSKERARQLHKSAIAKLRKLVGGKRYAA